MLANVRVLKVFWIKSDHITDGTSLALAMVQTDVKQKNIPHASGRKRVNSRAYQGRKVSTSMRLIVINDTGFASTPVDNVPL